jgi:hypothetical protein
MVIFRTSAEGVGHGVRRTSCGPFERRRPGFTLSRRSKGQVPGFSAAWPVRGLRIFASIPAFRPSVKLVQPTMPSADFSAAIMNVAVRSVRKLGHVGDLPR